MFERNKMLEKAVERLYEIVRKEKYGTKFTWDEIAHLSGIDGDDRQKLYYVANKVCLLLMRNDQKYLETVANHGKRIVNPSEHNVLAKKKVNRSVKIYRKAGNILASTNLDELDEEQKNEVITSANKYRTLEMFTTEMLNKKQIGKSSKDDIKTAGLFLDAIKMFSDKK